MPYNSVSEVPDNVPKSKRKQWLEVWNSSYKEHHDESRAFAEANSVAGPNSKVRATGDGRGWKFNGQLLKAAGTRATGFVRAIEGPFKCGHCAHMEDGRCTQKDVLADPEVKSLLDADGLLPVDAGDCCNEYDPISKAKTVTAGRAKAMGVKFRKFIPFVKVDEAKREVWGIVTAEVPDKDKEVCDYEGSKPYYRALISEMSKATNGNNLFPLREMHQLSAVGKCIGFEMRDTDKEIFMGFKVVDDGAWKKVSESVYTGFSQGGSIVGDLTPDPVYKGCMRYVADPSEASLVDNPCLGVAHFTYVKSDGAIELRKIKSEAITRAAGEGVVPGDHSGQSDVPTGSSQPQPVSIPSGAEERSRTPPETLETLHKEEDKRDGVKYLVESGSKGSLPYTGADGKPDHNLMGAAWAALHGGYRGNKYEGEDKSGAISRLKHIYEQEGMDTPAEKSRKVLEAMRPVIRKWANRNTSRIQKLSARTANLLLYKLDPQVGALSRKQPLAKGMFEVSRLACSIQDLAYMVCGIACEQEWEQDTESQVAGKLATQVGGMLDTFLEYAEEEARELRQELTAHMAATA